MLQRSATRATLFACSHALWLLCCVGCKDLATIGGLCPAGCDVTADAEACVCKFDAGVDACAGCVGDAAACAANHCRADDEDACASPGCIEDGGAMCAPGSYPLQREQLALLVVIDDSATVYPWWSQLSAGFRQFLQEPNSNDLEVGLQTFGRPSPLETCDAQQFTDPIVAIAPLPDNLGALLQAIPVDITATTSTIPVLTGALQYASTWATAHPSVHVSVVLTTDASPGECDALSGDYNTGAAKIASAAQMGSPAIDTYVVGFGSLSTPGLLATAGGTSVTSISVMPTDREVQGAFDKVRAAAQRCTFALSSGLTLSPTSRVVITPASGAEQRYDIERGAASCDHDSFYVEDETAAFPLNACPRTCAGLAAGDRLSLSSACSR